MTVHLKEYFSNLNTPTHHHTILRDDYIVIKSSLPHQSDEFYGDRSNYDIAITEYTEMLTDQAEFLPKNVIITHGIDETCNGQRIIDFTEVLIDVCDRLVALEYIDEYTVIVNDNHQPWVREILDAHNNVMILHWFMMSYSYYYPECFTWNKNAGKVLYLPGKIDKIHRICPVLEMFKKNYLESTVYSFLDCNTNSGIRDSEWYQSLYNIAKQFDPDFEYNIIEFTRIVQVLHSDLDGLIEKSRLARNFCMSPVSSDLYNQTNVELISETWLQAHLHLTEKTFRAILAGQPFIHIGTSFTKQLESLGFRTFNHYTGQSNCYVDMPEILQEGNDKHYNYTIKVATSEIHRALDTVYKFSDICNGPIITQSIQNDINFNAQHLRNIVESKINILEIKHNGFDRGIAKMLFTITGA